MGVRRLPLGLGGDVGVGVQGESSRVVAQHPRDSIDVHAVLERQGGEGVPEVVKSHFGQSRSLQYPVELAEDTVWGDGAAVGGREYPGAAPRFFPLLFQDLEGLLRQRQRPVGVFRF